MLESKKATTMFMIALLLMTATVTNSINASGTQLIPASVENTLIGAGSYGSIADGLSIALGIATLCGCFWCAPLSVGLKVATLLYN